MVRAFSILDHLPPIIPSYFCWPFNFMIEIRQTQPRSAQTPRTCVETTPPAATLRMSVASASIASPRTADSESSSEKDDEWIDDSAAESSDDDEGEEEEDEEKEEEESKESKEEEDWVMGGQDKQHRVRNGASRTSAFLLDIPGDISRPAAAELEDPDVAKENVSERSKKRLFSAVTDAVATPRISSPSLRVNAPAAAAAAAQSSFVPEPTAKINSEGPVLFTPHLTIDPSTNIKDASNSTWLTARMEKTGYPQETVQLCHNILLIQQGFMQESLFAELTEGEFNTAFLKEIGIAGKGTQVYLMRLHRELRAQYFGPVDAAISATKTSEAAAQSAQRQRFV